MTAPHPTREPARRGFLALVAALAFGALAAPAVAQNMSPSLTEGKEYVRLKNPVPVDSGKKIEVLEFFSYGCPHCKDLDPELQAWEKSLPADVEFKRVPVDFGREQWANLGKVYYTLDAMGVLAKYSPLVFDALHGKGTQLYNDKTFFDWAAAQGLDRKKVEETYASFGVTSKMNRAKQIAKTYSVQSVPMIVVDGKFVTAPDKVGSHQATPAAINALVAKAKAERPKG
jgi:thiol:disulfide interchange protein DsbA